jgi:hypothetical protein
MALCAGLTKGLRKDFLYSFVGDRLLTSCPDCIGMAWRNNKGRLLFQRPTKGKK